MTHLCNFASAPTGSGGYDDYYYDDDSGVCHYLELTVRDPGALTLRFAPRLSVAPSQAPSSASSYSSC